MGKNFLRSLLTYVRYSSGQVECHQREDYLDSVYVLWKMEYLKFKNLTLHVFYEWFGLRFTGAGLPSLARRARVPADSATLLRSMRLLALPNAGAFTLQVKQKTNKIYISKVARDMKSKVINHVT